MSDPQEFEPFEPHSPEKELLHPVVRRALRLLRLHRAGQLMIYSPVLGILTLFTAFSITGAMTNNFNNLSTSSSYALALAGLLLFLSLPAFVVGVGLRAYASWRLRRVEQREHLAEHLVTTPLTFGERLGWWVVERSRPEELVVGWSPAPMWARFLLRAGVWSFIGVTVLAAASRRSTASVKDLVLMGICVLFYLAIYWELLSERRLIARATSRGGQISLWKSFHRWLPGRTLVLSNDGLRVLASDRVCHLASGKLAFRLSGFPRGVLGYWQQHRLLHTIALVMGWTDEPDEATDDNIDG